MKIRFVVFTLIFALTALGFLLPNERALLEFETRTGKRLVVAIDTTEQYMVYRYGNPDSVEFEFPETLSTSWSEFRFSWYLRGGGVQNEGLDLNYLYFVNNGFKYTVFEEYSAHSDETFYGIRVTDLETEQETEIKADLETVKGTLYDCRNLEPLQQDE